MWGGVHGALPMIQEQIEDWSDRYFTLHFFLPYPTLAIDMQQI